MAQAARHRQGGRLPAPGRRQPRPVAAAPPQGGRQARPRALPRRSQRRGRGVGGGPARRDDGGPAAASATPARGCASPLLLRPLRSTDRRGHGHQHRRGQEPRLPWRRRAAPELGVLLMSTFDPNDGFGELLRSSMRDEADTVMPAGDGLSRIQQRVAARRARLRWMRPAAVLGSAALLAGVSIGAYAAVHGDGGTDQIQPAPPATHPTAETPSISPSPSPTTAPVAAPVFPKHAIFPFVSAKDERAWEHDSSATSSWGNPRVVATSWVATFLQLPSVNQVMRTKSTPTNVDLTLGRMQSDASAQRPIAVTTVHLVKYGKAWIVTGAADDNRLLRISSPTAGTAVTSPFVATGPGGGVDRAASVQVRDATTVTKYGEGHTGSFGSPQGWSASVSFATPSKPVGVLLAVEASPADGLPLRVAAQQVRFGSSSVSAGPTYFYGIKNGRVTKFHARDGSAVDYLTDPQPGGGASDPQLVGSDIY